MAFFFFMYLLETEFDPVCPSADEVDAPTPVGLLEDALARRADERVREAGGQLTFSPKRGLGPPCRALLRASE